MIQKFVDRFMGKKEEMLAGFKAKCPSDYADLVKQTIMAVTDDWHGDDPDPERIHQIDDGQDRGTLLFIIAAKGYQPSTYWSIFVSYGSCSACDAFESIGCYGDKQNTDEQAKEYWDLCLHMVQSMKLVGEP